MTPEGSDTPATPDGVLLTIAYDGRRFHGFASQPGTRTIAGELLGAVRALAPRVAALRGTSRTDAGVHALGQLVAFDPEVLLPTRAWALALARHLPEELAVVRASRVAAGFEPRRHVVTKTYRYVLLGSRVRDPFLEGRAWRVPDRLNQIVMQEAAERLVGEHDFAAFRSSADERENTVRRLVRVEVRTGRSDQRILEIVVEGDRFLHHMVRIIAGTLVDVGRGKLGANAIARAFERRERSDLGITAPPDGLYLDSIVLDDMGNDAWPG